MKRLFSIITFVTLFINQTGNATPQPANWNASWIAAPGDDGREYGVYYFRKQLELAARPAYFIIHVSADNRYKLFVNDSLVSLGPTRGDLYNWNYETVDLASFLSAGKNIVAAMLHPNGKIAVSYQLQNGKWAMNIHLPAKTSGTFIWKGKEYELKAGENKF